MRRIRRLPPFRRSSLLALLSLVELAVLPALVGCADVERARDVTTMSPEALRGQVVLSRDGERELGDVADVTLGSDGRPALLQVVSGAPMFPTARTVRLDPRHFIFSRERNGLMLIDATADQFAALPPAYEENVLALGGAAVPPGRAPTDWSGATTPSGR